MVSADMPMGQLGLAAVYLAQGKPAKAENAYRNALTLDLKSVGALLNLADLYRAQGDEMRALATLVESKALLPGSAAVRYSLGLAQIRNQQPTAALASLKDAVELEPKNIRYSYTYALMLNGQGSSLQALEVLQVLLEQAPSNYDFLFAAITISRDLGHLPEARAFAKRLIAIFPQDQSANQLLLTL